MQFCSAGSKSLAAFTASRERFGENGSARGPRGRISTPSARKQSNSKRKGGSTDKKDKKKGKENHIPRKKDVPAPPTRQVAVTPRSGSHVSRRTRGRCYATGIGGGGQTDQRRGPTPYLHNHASARPRRLYKLHTRSPRLATSLCTPVASTPALALLSSSSTRRKRESRSHSFPPRAASPRRGLQSAACFLASYARHKRFGFSLAAA
jgi:hypothetical protein